MKKLLALILLLASYGATSQTVQGTALRITTLNGLIKGNGTTNATVITDNSTNWNTAYTDRLKWDGGATDLVAATGRTSLGGTTIGQAVFTSTNPSAERFGIANADNTFTWATAAAFRTAIGVVPVTFGTAFQFPFINSGATDFTYSSDMVWNNSGSYPTFNSVAPVSTSSGFAIKNNAGTSIAVFGVGSTSSTNSTWTGNTVVTGNWDVSGTVDAGNLTIGGNSITESTGNDIQIGSAGIILTADQTGDDIELYANTSGGIITAEANNGIVLTGASNVMQVDASGVTLNASQTNDDVTITSVDDVIVNATGDFALTKTTNQIVTGAGSNLTTVNFPASSGAVTVTMPNVTSTVLYNGYTNPSFTTSITTPLVIGGTGTTSSLTYKTTTGVGTTGADHIFQVDNNGATEAMRITNGANILSGITTPRTFSGSSIPTMQVEGTVLNSSSFSLFRNSATDAVAAAMYFGKSGSGSNGGVTACVDNEWLGRIFMQGTDGAGVFNSAEIRGVVDGTVSTGIVPGSWEFHTVNSSGTSTLAWTITSSQHLVPGANNLFDVGTNSVRVRTDYTVNQTTTNAETVDSDSTLKTNIRAITKATEKVKQLKPVEYTWKADSLNKIHYGLIAQDVQYVLPEVVTKREDSGTLGVAYTELIPYLIQTIKELEARVSELENE